LFAITLHDGMVLLNCEGKAMDLMTTKDAAEQWGISVRRIQVLCDNGKVSTAFKLGGIWVMPKGTPKPIDGRTKAGKQCLGNEQKEK
jgi:hypothetical protein